MIGTPEYMSPEQVEGQDADQRSDIYSLGILLYEMLAGRLPFEAETPFAVGMKQKGEAPDNPQKFNPHVPDELSLIVLKCLEKDKEKRYQSAVEIQTALENIEKGIPTTEREIPKKRPLTSREITVTLGIKKLMIPAIIATVLIIAAVVIWRLLPRKEIIPVPSDKPSLAVMYFKNNTGDSNLDHWRTMLSNLLIADFTQSQFIRVLGEDKIFKILSDLNQLEAETYSSEVLEQVAVDGRVNHILQGAYAKAGDEFRINVMLQDANSGELIGSETVAGKGEESIFLMVDELTKRIKANFDLSPEEIAGDVDKEVGKITTTSPEAFRYYSEGRKYFYSEDYRTSIDWMKKALEADPEFAMAYRSMGVAFGNMLMYSESRRYLQKAFELSDQLSDREQYLLKGEFFREAEGTYSRAIKAYTNLLKLYPEDDIGNANLSLLYLDLEQWDEAIERCEVLIRNRDESFFPYSNKAIAFRAKGLYKKSEEILESYIENFQDSSAIRLDLDLNHLYQGDYEHAFAELDKAISLYPDNIRNKVHKGVISHCSGDYTSAENAYLEILETKEIGYHLYARTVLGTLDVLKGKYKSARNQHKRGMELAKELGDNWWKLVYHIWVAHNYLESGSPDKALKECEIAWGSAQDARHDLRWQRRTLYFKGRAQVGMDLLEEAQETASVLKDMIEKGMNSKEIRLYQHLLGMIELEKKNFSRAIDYFKQAESLLPFPCSLEPFTNDQALFADGLALAYFQAGDLDKAQEEYERIIPMPTGILYWGDIYAKSFYMLGKIHEQQGDTAKAIEHYEKFLDLWKDADPGIAEVEDARKRLAGLK
jgi:tetratricopeptide (TPR) repeat protein